MSFSVRRVSDEKPHGGHTPWKRLGRLALGCGHPLLQWYVHWVQRREEEERKRKLRILLQRILISLLALLCSALLLAGLSHAIGSLKLLSLRTVTTLTGGAPKADSSGHTTILLLGQGDEEQGKDLTDSILVLSLDPKDTQSVVLLSLPRDLYFVKTETLGSGRLNSLYRDRKYQLHFRKKLSLEEASAKALEDLKDEIGRALGEEMHYVFKVDFRAFIDVIDALGGIDIDVPYDIEDPAFPGPNYTYELFEIKKGMQHLDGETALKYARSRSTTSDFDRSKRQQQILMTLSEKALTSKLHRNPGKLLSVLRDVSPHLETNSTAREILGLALELSNLDPTRTITMQLSDRNGLYGEPLHPGGLLYTPPRDLFEGASILLPLSIPEYPVTWKQVQAFTELLFHHRSFFLEKPTLSILNAGAPSGSAGKIGNELRRVGFEVETMANAGIGKLEETFLAPRAMEGKPFAEELASILGIPEKPLPQELAPELVKDITIILAKDYTFQPLQSFLPPPPL